MHFSFFIEEKILLYKGTFYLAFSTSFIHGVTTRLVNHRSTIRSAIHRFTGAFNIEMPATAGRVRMPANNRVHSSAALQTHGIWQMTIKYDPYAPNKEDKGSSSQVNASSVEPEGENAYASFQGLLALAKITNSNNPDEVRGACKKCGRVGHLSFQCRNFLSVKNDNKEKDADEIQANVLAGLDRLKASVGKGRNLGGEESEEESDEESDDSDSSRDSEIERIIAERQGKRVSGKSRSSRKNDSSDEEKERRRSKKRSGKRDEVDSGRKRRKRDESSDEDEERKRRRRRDTREKRRSHRYTDDDSSDEDEEHRHMRRRDRKEKRRSHRYSDDSSSDEDEERRHRRRRDRKEKRRSHRCSDDSSSGEDEERKHRRRRDKKEKRRSHRYLDDSKGSSKGHKSKSRRTSSMESDGYQSRSPHHSRESELAEKKIPKYADGYAE